MSKRDINIMNPNRLQVHHFSVIINVFFIGCHVMCRKSVIICVFSLFGYKMARVPSLSCLKMVAASNIPHQFPILKSQECCLRPGVRFSSIFPCKINFGIEYRRPSEYMIQVQHFTLFYSVQQLSFYARSSQTFIQCPHFKNLNSYLEM